MCYVIPSEANFQKLVRRCFYGEACIVWDSRSSGYLTEIIWTKSRRFLGFDDVRIDRSREFIARRYSETYFKLTLRGRMLRN